MNKRENWYKKLSSFDNLNVRNLFWLLFSPNLINEHSIKGVPSFPDNWLDKWYEHSEDFFIELNENSSKLDEFINESNSYRLGIYAERLLQYFFENFSETRLLLCNYQVFNGKTTIGEIDFVIEWEDWLLHIELAVKYYLLNEDKNKLHEWIGPSGKDNLGKKIEKVKKHQLKLSQNENFVNSTQLSPTSFFMLKGMLFSPFQTDFEAPNWLNQNIDKRNYMRWTDFKDFAEKNKNIDQFVLLLRPNWMASLIIPSTEYLELSENWQENEAMLDRYGAFHIYDLKNKTTFMVVKDKWPEK